MRFVNKKIKLVVIITLVLIEISSTFLMYKSFNNKDVELEEVKLNINEIDNNMFAIMIEQEDGTYAESEDSTWPKNKIFNEEKSGCIDANGNKLEGVLSFDRTNNIATVETGNTAYCYLYFDQDNSVYAKVVSDYENSNGVALLSATENNNYPVYYYTGSITNNNILYVGYCWKMVITTETGGIKLIYNGEPTEAEDGTKTCNNSGTSSQLASTKAFNSNYKSVAHVGYMYNTVYEYSSKTLTSVTDLYKYGNSFEDSDGDGIYELTNVIEFSDWSSNYNTLSNNHYTCFNTSGECAELNYIYYTTSSTAYYITLSGGKTVEEALNEMLYADDVNKTDSTIKDYIDTWYEGAILGKTDESGNLYSDYLENTIFCNNRATTNLSSSGWNPNGGSTISTTSFMKFNYESLECENKLDQFTLKVDAGGEEGYGNNALDYPIGLLTYKEASLATTSGYLKSGSGYNYWLLSPYSSHVLSGEYTYGPGVYYLSGANFVYYPSGVRPVVSLSSEIMITSGDGSVTNPYQVEKE